MSNQNLSRSAVLDQLKIWVSIRPGGGQAAFFADVGFFDNMLTIPDWPVWNGKNGDLQPALPNKVAKDGKRHPTVKVKSDLLTRIFRAIREACKAARC